MEEKKIFTDTKLLSSSSPSDNIGGSAVEPFDVDEEIALNENGQHDRLKLVYWIMLIHGVGVLMPWNMFITAQDVRFGIFLLFILKSKVEKFTLFFFSISFTTNSAADAAIIAEIFCHIWEYALNCPTYC